MKKLNKSNISDSERQTFGITLEEWTRMQEEEDKDEKTREYLRGLEKEYVKINEDCSSRMDPPPVLEKINGNNKRDVDKGESLYRSKFGAKIASDTRSEYNDYTLFKDLE
ncbi:hypothetical protein RclHR1_16580002 [Rhizophagus clarus]|uniref:Uncharacterized protein n=1 Tax=Rhizophagus clarus TaxID=94130 RepID=A0A2Z6QYJ8_9GLOM|nr:hypothetical protein RclHR1_16580002 [Rhizophagus clarus]GET00704.1 hypothetical protein RCL_jg29038.t1 [Rhizophagus clarus]